jgi:hypothetical protein
MIAYKIIRKENNKFQTLFHGLNGSKVIKLNIWLEANVDFGRDGSGNRYYIHGWHSFLYLNEAKQYLNRFKETENLTILKCEVKDTWKKEHSPAPIILSRYIKFLEEIK